VGTVERTEKQIKRAEQVKYSRMGRPRAAQCQEITVAGVEFVCAPRCYRILGRRRGGSSGVVDEADGTSPAGRGSRVVGSDSGGAGSKFGAATWKGAGAREKREETRHAS